MSKFSVLTVSRLINDIVGRSNLRKRDKYLFEMYHIARGVTMENIRYVCLSDMHFGADSSVLTNLGPGDNAVDPSKASEVLIYLTECLRTLIAQNSSSLRPTLILNGDIFEFALSTDNVAAMAFQRFLELSMPQNPGDRLFDSKIIYLPGNHDHHLWESAREIQYATYLQQVPAQSFLPEPWHTTKMIDPTDVPSLFADAVVRRCSWLSDVSVATVYPNLALIGADKLVIFTHGHFTEKIYLLMTTLADAMFPNRPPAKTTYDWEAENFAWIDFFWSTIGRSGPLGPDFELIYEMMQDPKKFGGFVGRAASTLLRLYGGSFGRHFGSLLAVLIRSMITGRLERAQPEKWLSDDGAGLLRYLQIPVQEQLEQELKGQSVPKDITVVFGHTHKPFEQMMQIENFLVPHMRVYNSGGWVVDRPKPQSMYGGAAILLDENLDAVSIRMYNESERLSDYRVTVGAAGPPPNSPSPFFNWVKRVIKPELSPWSNFSAAAAAAVDAHARKIAATLARRS